jgi:N-acetylglucosamine-6-phosphate deacetylase
MRKFSAHYVFVSPNDIRRNAIIECTNDGLIISVSEQKEKPEEIANLEFYSGVICPGFILLKNETVNINNTFLSILQSKGFKYIFDVPKHNSNCIGLNVRSILQFEKQNISKAYLGLEHDSMHGELNLSEVLYQLQETNNVNFKLLLRLLSENALENISSTKKIGSIKKGYIPGLVHIQQFNMKDVKLSQNSSFRLLI